jgi:hypothetical protein
MSIIVDSVQSLSETGQFLLQVRIDGRPFSYKSYVNDDRTFTGIDTEFYLLLSDRALAERGDSTVYITQLSRLLRMPTADQLLGLPIAFGCLDV